MDRHLTDTWCSPVVNPFCKLPFHFLICGITSLHSLTDSSSCFLTSTFPFLAQSLTCCYDWSRPDWQHPHALRLSGCIWPCQGLQRRLLNVWGRDIKLEQHEHSWAIKAPVRQRQSAGGWVASCSLFRQKHWSREKKLPPNRGCPGNNDKWEDASMQ